MYERSSHWKDFRDIYTGGLLLKSIDKIQIRLKSRKKVMGILHEDLNHLTFFCSSTKYFVVRKLQCKGTHFSVSMATFGGFIFLTITCRSTTIQGESIVAFA
jgi:hypothetical protein